MIVRALELKPNDGFITDSLGWVYFMRARALQQGGRQEEGRAELARAIADGLEPYRACFEAGESAFVSSEGRARLIAEFPDIASELGIR